MMRKLSEKRSAEQDVANLSSKVSSIHILDKEDTIPKGSPQRGAKTPKYYDDIPSFDLLKDNGSQDDPSSPQVTKPPLAATNKDGTSTREKKNRRKRAAVNPNPNKKPKRIKLDDNTILSYTKYISRRVLKKPTNEDNKEKDPPQFIRIAGFHATYEEFYESLKPRAQIGTAVMTLWTYQYNLDEAELFNKDKSIVKRFAFSTLITAPLKVAPEKFNVDSFNSIILRLNKTWDFSIYDLLFFPIVHDEHWVLTCINVYRKQINYFDSFGSSKSGPQFQAHTNMVQNFSRAAMESKIVKDDISKFQCVYPIEYPQQSTLNDCGLYTMLYMESWDGNKMNTDFESSMIHYYRKLVAGSLIFSQRNEISLEDFDREHGVVDPKA